MEYWKAANYKATNGEAMCASSTTVTQATHMRIGGRGSPAKMVTAVAGSSAAHVISLDEAEVRARLLVT